MANVVSCSRAYGAGEEVVPTAAPIRGPSARRLPWIVRGGIAFLGLLVGGVAQAQPAPLEALAFDRPESWAMKYFTALSLPTALGLPEPSSGGAIRIGLEGGLVPQLSDDQRRVGFAGTKLEDVNRTHVLGRLRAAIGLSTNYSLEVGYVPPVKVNGATPHIITAAVGRPFSLAPNWQLGVRVYAQLGTMKGDITCSAQEAAAGLDPVRNPYLCQAASDDELKQKLAGLEVTTGYSGGRWHPYLGVSVAYLDLKFQVNARYSGIIDNTLQTTNGETVYFTAGLGYSLAERWRLAGELFYEPLSVVRPPRVASQNDGLLNGRFLISYRF